MSTYEHLKLDKPELRRIGCTPLQPTQLLTALRVSSAAECEAIVRLLITETPPRAFTDFPLMFEFARQFLADKLETHPKQVCLTGSARLGFATPPSATDEKRWGRPMNETSDLDFFIVCNSLFAKCHDEVLQVRNRQCKSVAPHHEDRNRDIERWKSKASNMLKPNGAIERGFFDERHMPLRSKPAPPVTTTIRRAAKSLYREWSKRFNFSPIPKGAPTIRIYKDWPAAIKQLSISLQSAAQEHT